LLFIKEQSYRQGRNKKKRVRRAKLKIKGGLSIIFKIFTREGLEKKNYCRGPPPRPPPLLIGCVIPSNAIQKPCPMKLKSGQAL